ncbi:MAG: ABC transporter ATP-binding protein [Phycisphaeraceae bacterium]|nr:ABC transporter ATP-binding protein [Phycisphaeraceae bacterium]MCW5753984.1 ABC transporter ATP-binding protein [Phycisphaeraceae bacterium]
MQAFWHFASRLLRFRSRLVIAFACALFGAGGLGAGILAAKPAIENVLGERRGLDQIVLNLPFALPADLVAMLPTDPFLTVLWIVIFLAILTVLAGTANFLHAALSLGVVYAAVTDIRREAFHRVMRFPLKRVIVDGTADTVSRLINDTTQLAGGFTSLLSKAVTQTGKGVAALIAAFILDWRLTLISLIVAPVIAITIRKLSKRIRRASKRALQHQADLLGAATEALQGLRVVKTSTAERYEMGRFQRINRQVMRQMLAARTARALSSPLNEVLGLLTLFALLLLSAKFILDGKLDPTTFMMTLGALFISAASLKPLTGIITEIQTSGAAAQRIAELMSGPPEEGHDRRLPKLPPHHQVIEFRDVTFTYPNAAAPSLRNVSLTIPHGQTIAVVGPNGSGKTTLLSLLPRLFDPDAGQVLIDGHDIRTVALRSLRRQIGVVTQETVIFQSTVADNIAYGASGATRERIEDAAKRARADEFIQRLPNTYDALISERGGSLSGGQRQRLAIARAILRDPAILILDEATSMIDADSEAKIADALAEFTRGRTCFIVAHRLSTVRSADRIIVMDQGAVVDQGGHDELLARCPTYRLIAQRQLFAPV